MICSLLLLSLSDHCLSSVLQPIVSTGQKECFNANRAIPCPSPSEKFHGQDGNYIANLPAYKDNRDGTITDLVTGLMWSKGVDKTKVSLSEANTIASSMSLGGYSDWRVPNIKELYSLMNFNGNTGTPPKQMRGSIPGNAVPFINTDFFDFRYGNTEAGERYIDAQWLTSTRYASTTMGGNSTLFGVNFADGRIKGYPHGQTQHPKGEKKFYARYVRGSGYGDNVFQDNRDGTITDKATGLMWAKHDSQKAMNWQSALEYAEKANHSGYDDWRLPHAKELQYIVDYTRSPDTTKSPAIDPIFDSTAITNEAGQSDYPFYWTSTTHKDGPMPNKAVYICFGRGLGQMRDTIMDVHGAGSQRSDPKQGIARLGHGPQGDVVRVKNFVRLVRGGQPSHKVGAVRLNSKSYPVKVTILSKPGQTSASPRRPFPEDYRARRPTADSRRQHFILRLDTNGDNKVSPSEFDGPKKHFQQFDRDNNGYITIHEAPTGPPPRKR